MKFDTQLNSFQIPQYPYIDTDGKSDNAATSEYNEQLEDWLQKNKKVETPSAIAMTYPAPEYPYIIYDENSPNMTPSDKTIDDLQIDWYREKVLTNARVWSSNLTINYQTSVIPSGRPLEILQLNDQYNNTLIIALLNTLRRYGLVSDTDNLDELASYCSALLDNFNIEEGSDLELLYSSLNALKDSFPIFLDDNALRVLVAEFVAQLDTGYGMNFSLFVLAQPQNLGVITDAIARVTNREGKLNLFLYRILICPDSVSETTSQLRSLEDANIDIDGSRDQKAELFAARRENGLVHLVEDITSENENKPAFTHYFSGETFKIVSDIILGVVRHDEDVIASFHSVLQKAELAIGYPTARLVFEAIKLLGADYLTAGYTSTTPESIISLSQNEQEQIYLIEGALLCTGRGILSGDCVAVTANLNYHEILELKHSEDAVLKVGGMGRYTMAERLTYAEECIPVTKLDHFQDELRAFEEGESSVVGPLFKLANLEYPQALEVLTNDEKGILEEFWGIYLTAELSLKEGKEIIRAAKKALISGRADEYNYEIAPFVLNEDERLEDERFKLIADILCYSPDLLGTQSEGGRLVKMYDKNELNSLFPKHDSHMRNIMDFYSLVEEASGDKGSGYARAFIQAKPGLLGLAEKSLRLIRTGLESNDTVVHFMWPVPIKNGVGAPVKPGMKGYFEKVVIDIRCFEISDLIAAIRQIKPELHDMADEDLRDFWLGKVPNLPIAVQIPHTISVEV